MMNLALSTRWIKPALVTGLLAGLLFSNAALAGDIDKLVGPDECGECHKKEVAAWRDSRHYKTFNELARTKEAKAIAKKLGLSRIKRESACLDCHFTVMNKDGKPKAMAGITCESCHGAAQDWLKVHSDYGGKDVKKEQETAAHKKQRLDDSVAGGMLRPDDLYAVANNCYQCHLVPNEELVNKGGHKAGSPFELVAWSQGEVRHNFFSSADGEQNLAADTHRKRMMFVLGIVLELEHSLRAVGEATEKADYAVKMAKRAKKALAKLKKVASLIKAPELDEIVKIASAAKLKLNNKAQLNEAATKAGEQGRGFAISHDGSAFSALDKYLPKKFKGKVHG